MELWQIPVLFLMMPVSFAVTVIIHEYGHWLGGIFSGYRTVYICLFSLAFYKDKDRKNRNARYPGMPGQCIMVPRKKDAEPNPHDLVAGGPAASLLAGVIFAAAMFILLYYATDSSDMMPIITFGMLSTFNIAFGITNLIPNGTNDGANLKEVKASDANKRAYNKLMKIYELNVLGYPLQEIPDDLLETPEGAKGSLADELAEYAKMKKEYRAYMARTTPELITDASNADPDRKRGSWELWQQCRKAGPAKTEAYLAVCRKHMKNELGLGEWKTCEALILKYAELNGQAITPLKPENEERI